MSRSLDLAVDLAKGFEGLRLEPYQDSAGVWTIGRGSTRGLDGNPVTADTPPITEAEADALMARDMKTAHDAVVELASGWSLSDGAVAALTDMAYNDGIGAVRDSTLIRLLSQGDRLGAAKQFLVWDHAGGQELYGLFRRCAARAHYFCNII
jgi:GH24 family phage-related lysozyme (muramidase)